MYWAFIFTSSIFIAASQQQLHKDVFSLVMITVPIFLSNKPEFKKVLHKCHSASVSGFKHCEHCNFPQAILCVLVLFSASLPASYTFMLHASCFLSQDDCLPCLPGYYCDAEGLSAPSGPCWEGFFCLKGTDRPDPPWRDSRGGPCPEGEAVVDNCV